MIVDASFVCITKSNNSTMNLTKVNDLLEAAQLAINNTQNDPSVKQRLEAYGLTPARFQRGKTLLRTLEQKDTVQTKIQDERWALSQQINASLLATRDQFKEHARLALVAFRQDPALLHALKIERIATRRWDCVRQAAYFYQAFQERKLTLEGLGISAKEIQQTQAAVTQLLRLKEARVLKKGIAEQGTEERRQTQAELREWLMEFRAIARAAYRSQSQMLEVFGLRVATAG